MASEKPTGVTLSDVAREAGFSRSTASLVFQNNPVVAESTRDSVLSAAKRLGYVYNRRAASMRQAKSNSIGVLIGGFANPFFAQLTEAIEETLSPAGYSVLLGNTFEDPDRQNRLMNTFLENRVDGLMIVPAIGSDAEFLDVPLRLGLPLVVLTRLLPGLDVPYFGTHDFQAGQKAAEHLVAHGVRSLAYFGGPADVYSRVDRLSGVEDVARDRGVLIDARWTIHTKTTSTNGYLQAKSLLEAGHRPEALICHSDAIAIGVMRALYEEGLSIGKDVRVVGFDDVEVAPFTQPSLTSMSVEAADMGRGASHAMMEIIAGSQDRSECGEIFDAQLIVRESCGDHF